MLRFKMRKSPRRRLHKSVWQQEAGIRPLLKAPLYFGRAEQQWIVNSRVDDLGGLIASLTASGIVVETPEREQPCWDLGFALILGF